jgi:ubiquinone/menaquinone biosynthesis C-methylase UbiE
MAIFRRGSGRHEVAVAMTGVKLGDRLLQIGCRDPSLLAAIASKVGLSGRACVATTSEAEADRARKAGERGGVLLEVERTTPGALPFEDASFDLVVVDNLGGLLSNMKPETRVRWLQHAHRTLVPRGRIVVIERALRAGLGGLFRPGPIDPHSGSSGGAETALKAEGFKAVRHLAERDGMSFFEGIR